MAVNTNPSVVVCSTANSASKVFHHHPRITASYHPRSTAFFGYNGRSTYAPFCCSDNDSSNDNDNSNWDSHLDS